MANFHKQALQSSWSPSSARQRLTGHNWAFDTSSTRIWFKECLPQRGVRRQETDKTHMVDRMQHLQAMVPPAVREDFQGEGEER